MSEAATLDNERHSELSKSGHSNANQPWSQHVTFLVDNRSYGIEITNVREIKGWSEPTDLPETPHGMRGVLNLRGVIVPVFDLRAHFGYGVTEACDEHVVIIVALDDRLVGVLVDAVSDILTVEPGEVLPVPEMNADAAQRFLSGLVSRDDQLVALLRLEELFAVGHPSSDLLS